MSRRDLADVERALADLAASLEFPPTPDLAAAVTARLEEGPERAPTPRARRWRWPAGWRRLAVAGLAAVLLAAAVLVASPGTREAVARRLGLRGIGVQIGGPPPPTVTTAPGARLDLGLGERVSLEEARRRVGFPVLVPGTGGLGQPDAVFVSENVPMGGRVDLVWRARPGLPASAFFSCEPHFFTYRDAAGNLRDEQTRLAGNTLIWQRGDLTLRLEGELSKEEAVRIAESMR
jgi:hypothetical protein